MSHQLYVKIKEDYLLVDSFIMNQSTKTIVFTSVEDAIQKYITLVTVTKCPKNQHNEVTYFKKLSTFLSDRGVKFINEATPEQMREFEVSLSKTMKDNSVNRRFGTIKNFFKTCLHWNLIHTDPCENIKKRKVEKNRRKPWTYEDFSAFIDLCDGIRKKIFIFLWLTGCRPSEAKRLLWTDINYEEKTILFRTGKTNDKVRQFPLTDALSALLHSIKPETIFVFSENGKQINNDQLYHYCKNRMKRLGLHDLSPYGARHGFGTKLANQNISAFHIARLMGHSDIKTTMEYVHSEKKVLHEIASQAK